ncbi:hypothetical protein vseg_018300 [Gypsophila vaccaria]
MLDFLFGWRKASTCKKLIRKTQCRLKLLKSKRLAVIRLLKADIAQLLRNGHEHFAMNKLESLYVEENVMSMYEMLNTFSEFILLNMSYIRRHKDIPNDVNEAISTLLFASARIGEIPELRVIRNLFMERYGKRFVAAAVELCPGNFVNSEVKDKLSSRSVPKDVKNRMVDEIVRDYVCKLRPLAIDYIPDNKEQLQQVTESTEIQRRDVNEKKISSPANYSIVLRSSPSILNTHRQSKVAKSPKLSPPYEYKFGRNSSGHYINHDGIEEFMSPNKQRRKYDDPDQRFFVFQLKTQKPKYYKEDLQIIPSYHEKQATKRTRRKISATKENTTINDTQSNVYYSSSPGNRHKCQKKIHGQINMNKIQAFDSSYECQCSMDNLCNFYANDSNQGIDKLVSTQICREIQPYVRSTTMPQQQEKEISKDIRRTSSLPVENVLVGCSGGIRNSGSPSHIHPKLPDYDEIATKFKALKKAHQKTKDTP